ncbi:HAD-superfamily hydrolase, subfamily IG, 5'-nucleotidase [Actinidia rufa]|uniref:HAD-superfamily hydrolase, subfamily IG, 5'-nucleotidase n=1 Tax=Actinidia rufa TaxID=165716 RepID=A0A7J0E0F6_9ERIC|nr:HAD-superfamily hydrolase, subfamily IG, 5'-nucleotidase [Actinidia rufa]
MPPTCNRNQTTLVPESDSPILPRRCLFKAKMRLPKRPAVTFCLSLFSPSQFHSPHFLLTHSSPLKRRAIHTVGVNQLHASYRMDGTGVDKKMTQFQSMNVSDGGQDPCIWSSPGGGQKINIGKQIFCNRPLNMRNIVAVGFDMDYTLAQYKPETFESLAYEGTIKKLVYDLGYPPEMDRHKYVKVAYHGFRELSKEDKVAAYGSTLIRDAFDEPDYALIDTLFSLAEAYLFAQLVDFKDNNPGRVPEGVDYSRMYRDVRAAVDLCHRDGTLKQMVAKDPKSAKPGFFHDENRANLFEVETDSGMLLNTDNGTPMPQVGDTVRLPLKSSDKSCKVFQGGNVGHLHKLLGIASSSQVLYVGDHIYGDILRSKKVLGLSDGFFTGWRTMLVVPELEKEVELLWELRDTRKQLRMMRNERDLVEDKIHHLKWSFKFEVLNGDEKRKETSELENLESQREEVRFSHQQAQRECHQKVERFACLYTSQVTNLSLYSPDKYYRPSEDFMPHEFDILHP